LVLLAGIAAGMQVGKLPPALAALKLEFGLSIVQASLFVTMFQVAGVSVGIVGGMLADRFGARRVMSIGLSVIVIASTSSTFAYSSVVVLALRALESAGFLLAVLPGPMLLRRLVAPEKLTRWLGAWGMYMPLGMGMMLLIGPLLIEQGGWRLAWWAASAMALVPLLMMGYLPRDLQPAQRGQSTSWLELVLMTIRRLGPWTLALAFGCYAAQWMSVFTFLPLIYEQAGISPATAGALTALAALINALGNGAAGWVNRWISPARVLTLTALLMSACSWVTFGSPADVGFACRYGGLLVFSSVGGLIPGTLFIMSARLAASTASVSTTVGLMQQGSALGQGLGPPIIALVAAQSLGWGNTWIATSLFACGVILAAWLMGRALHAAR
jgi:MFS transporter, CP family, cyanate transporter